MVQCFRIGKKTSSHKPRPVMVQFRSYDMKKDIVDAWRSKHRNLKKLLTISKDSPDIVSSMRALKSVYLNDDLTLLRRKILLELRSLKKLNKISDCWVYDGRISYKTSDGTMVHNVSGKMLTELISGDSEDNNMN